MVLPSLSYCMEHATPSLVIISFPCSLRYVYQSIILFHLLLQLPENQYPRLLSNNQRQNCQHSIPAFFNAMQTGGITNRCITIPGNVETKYAVAHICKE